MYINIEKKIFAVRRIIVTIILIAFGSGAYSSFGQSIVADTLTKHFSAYQDNNLQEKLFVHTDKSFYLSGEILWFKMYNVAGSLNKLQNLSKVAYLEVLDKDNNAIIQTMISLSQGRGSGSVYLPVSINSGNYKVRAYTRWMRNFSPEFYFQKNITIINSLKEPDLLPQENPVTSYDLSFYPEGGNLVSGIRSRIAFRGTDSNGKGFQVAGTVVDHDNKSVSDFKSLRFGIGSFYFTPGAGKYTALVKLPNGQVLRKALPDAFVTGYVMHADTRVAGKVKITVHNNTSLNSEITLFVHARNEKKVIETAQMINGKAEFVINKDEIGDGISSFTVFDQNKQPVCERLYFKRPVQSLNVNVITD
ncbi:MAG TPA: hypothetical protein VGD31_03545, partial [Sphingobacteriaceae bacterium]